ncbi:hypothetical protein [Chloroflexus sp.]|uniref:hypothetical protein n=1 Tax=Chloroflexus sp. TaxID=1904827 RepID=UPI003D134F8E
MLQSRWIILAVLALIVSVAIAPNNLVLAQPNPDSGVPGGPFSTAFRVQNLGSSNATCTYSVYNTSGGQSFNSPLPSINPGKSAYVYTPSVPSFPSGVFSAIISCDQPVAAVVNYSDSDSGDTFVGVSSPANKLYVPGVYDNYYNYYTSFRIMNASASNNNVTIKYYDGSTEITSETIALMPNGSSTVTHENRVVFSNNKIYSAVIEGSQPLAAIVQIYGKGPYDQQLYAYTAFSGGSKTAYVPLVMSNYYGYNTATSVQNVGTGPTSVTIQYSNGDTHTVTLSSGASHTFLDFNLLPPSNSTYSAVVTSTNEPIIVTVNESRSGSRLATTYEGFSSGSKSWVAPIVMKNYYGFQSSITCQNIGNGPANISVAFNGEAGGGPVTLLPQQKVSGLAVNQSFAMLQQFDNSLPNGFIGSAEITSDQDIICVINQSNQNVGATQDQLYAYNALIKQP